MIRIITSLLFSTFLYGEAISFKDNFSIDKILSNKKWEQLVYYDNDSSQVKDSDFFLSEEGKTNPKEELLATINGYSLKNINDNSPICLFPARYFFLKDYVNFKDYKAIHPGCTRLSNWVKSSDIESISLVLVSGYLSNPASTFGHSFIKLNSSNQDDLMNLSINYGAEVPANEGVLPYIAKGLTGLYDAKFSDKYFYFQDLVYSHTEFRDMWDYTLNLTAEQKNLVQLHLWEIMGKKFDYYFLSKNCGFRVSEILNLVSKKDLREKNNSWFLPVETFYDLEEESKLVSSVKFIPSNKTVLFASFRKLSLGEI